MKCMLPYLYLFFTLWFILNLFDEPKYYLNQCFYPQKKMIFWVWYLESQLFYIKIGYVTYRRANNFHLSGILMEFTKIFCKIQWFRYEFPYDLRINIACFTSILIVWQKMLGNLVRYRGKSEIFFCNFYKMGRFAQNFLISQIFSGN